MTKFKELCMDTARSSGELGRFWALATGCSYVVPRTSDDSGDVIGRVEGEVEGSGIAICLVPEEKSAKHRVHIDVHADSVDCSPSAHATLLASTTTTGRSCWTLREASSARSSGTSRRRTAPTRWSWTAGTRRRRRAGGPLCSAYGP